MKKLLLVALTFLFLATTSKATHIIGGEFTVKWLSGNTFRVTLHYYRDCSAGNAGFDNPITVGVYDKVTNVNQQCFSMPLISSTIIALGDNCYKPNLCVEEGIYETNVTLPNNSNGYYLSHSRCCRNGIITNIANPGSTGEVWYAEVPDPSLRNSTPVFGAYPKGYLCTSTPNVQNFSCTDPDGDSLVYSLITPLAGNTSNLNPIGNCPDAAPYPNITWASGYSAANMIGGSPPLSITPQTGIISAKPATLGVFVFCVRVEEFRRSDKKKLGEIRREVQFTSFGCTVAAAFPDTTICSGNPVQLQATGGTTYRWSPKAGLNDSTIANPIATVFTTTTYTVSVSSGGCVSTATVTIYVNNAQNVAITPNGPTSFCEGGSVILTASGALKYVWNTGETTSSITVNTTNTYSVVGTNQGCSGSATQAVTVTPNPVVTITPNGPTTLCQGGSVKLTAGGATSYSWSPGGSTASAITVNASATYTLTGTTNGCSGSATQAVTVNPAPIVTIAAGGPTTFCEGGSVTLNASGASTYKWNTAATTNSITVTTGQTFYTVGTDQNGCTAISNFITVVVNRRPTVVIQPDGPTTFCEGGQVKLCASGANTYTWSPGGVTGACITASTQGKYTVVAKNLNECSGSATIDVTVKPVPVVSISADGPTSFCPGESVTLTATGADSYIWSPNGETTVDITVNATNKYSVVGTTNGCSAPSNSIDVTVNAAIAVTIIPDGPTEYCEGGSVGLCATKGSSYLWSPGGETTQCITAVNPANYEVTVTNSGGCVGASSLQTKVNALPIVAITPDGPVTFCEPLSVNLTLSGANTYVWSRNGETTVSINVAESGTYFATGTDVNGCTDLSDPVAVTVNEVPTVAVTPNGPTEFCIGGSVTLTAASADNYKWNNGSTNASISVSDNGPYYVTGTDNTGCSSVSNTINVVVNALPVVVATPDGPTEFCEGGSVKIVGSGASTYVWSPNGEITATINAGAAGSYYTVGTDVNGCTGTSNVVTVTLTPKTEVKINSIPGLCLASPAYTLTGSPAGGTFSGPGVVGNTFNPALAGVGTFTITYTYNPQGACLANTIATTPVTVSPKPIVTISISPTIGCVNHTIYYGYGPQEVTLTANSNIPVTSYQWYVDGNLISGATAQTFVTNIGGSYTVVAFINGGCPSDPNTDPMVVNVVDIRCGHNLNKVVLCHVPPGNNNNPQTLCIAPSAVPAHIGNHPGDCLGPCGSGKKRLAETESENVMLHVYPNPFSSVSVIEFERLDETTHMLVEVYTLTGEKIVTLFDKEAEAGMSYQVQFDGSKLAAGVYMYKISGGGQVLNGKLVLVK